MKPCFTLFYLFPLLVMSSCRSLSYFESPNNLRNIEGIIYLQNGKTYQGKLVVETENVFGSPVKLFTGEERKPMQFRLTDVEGYTIGSDHFEVKEITEGISFGRRLFFMKRLTPKESKMHLFEFSKKETVNKTSVQHTPEFYVQLPGEPDNLVHSANGGTFVPHFEEKVSRIVKDCPALSQKIAARREGYFYAQVSLLKEKRAEVLMRIIKEFNDCGK